MAAKSELDGLAGPAELARTVELTEPVELVVLLWSV